MIAAPARPLTAPLRAASPRLVTPASLAAADWFSNPWLAVLPPPPARKRHTRYEPDSYRAGVLLASEQPRCCPGSGPIAALGPRERGSPTGTCQKGGGRGDMEDLVSDGLAVARGFLLNAAGGHRRRRGQVHAVGSHEDLGNFLSSHR